MQWTRREFLEKGRDAGFTITAAFASHSQMKAVPPSDRIRVAIVGIRGRGMGLALGFATRPDCEVAYLADPDASLFEEAPNPGYIRDGNISYRLGGRKLTIDAGSEKIAGDEEANGFLKREYRPPWTVPETV